MECKSRVIIARFDQAEFLKSGLHPELYPLWVKTQLVNQGIELTPLVDDIFKFNRITMSGYYEVQKGKTDTEVVVKQYPDQ